MVGYFCTSAYLNRKKALQYAEELKEYQRTLEARVLEQTRKIKDQTQKMLQIQEDDAFFCQFSLIFIQQIK